MLSTARKKSGKKKEQTCDISHLPRKSWYRLAADFRSSWRNPDFLPLLAASKVRQKLKSVSSRRQPGGLQKIKENFVNFFWEGEFISTLNNTQHVLKKIRWAVKSRVWGLTDNSFEIRVWFRRLFTFPHCGRCLSSFTSFQKDSSSIRRWVFNLLSISTTCKLSAFSTLKSACSAD